MNAYSLSPQFLSVTQNQPAYVGQSGPAAGMVRFNTDSQNLEAFNGSSWVLIDPGIGIGLNGTAEDVLKWAMEKMYDERELKARMEKYPSLKAAYDQFKLVEALVSEEESENT